MKVPEWVDFVFFIVAVCILLGISTCTQRKQADNMNKIYEEVMQTNRILLQKQDASWLGVKTSKVR